jgi:ferredoxin/flavodoxin---NADP+ reductase
MTLDPPLGSSERPVRVAVVGAGPAGFFTAEALLKSAAPVFDVDVLERLPTPFGLVRSGVAPDHQQIKTVHKTFEKTSAHERFRFLGNVRVGWDVSAAELQRHYDQVVYAIGSASDRRLGLPGEELTGSYAATAFVGWYNAHPDFAAHPFDLSHPRVVVVGVGNVAMDIARVLLRDPDELATTDIASHALEALRRSRVREVVMLARRGPAQAAFDVKELRDIAALNGVQVVLDAAQLAPEAERKDQLSAGARRGVEAMLAMAQAAPRPGARTLRLEFLASPRELLGDAQGHLRAVQVERTELVAGLGGELLAAGTGRTFELEAGALFRSVGYRGVPLAGVPFDAKAGVIPNLDGRVLGDAGVPVPGQYAVGWCRRGPTGVIGTNKADAAAVAQRMVADVPSLAPAAPALRGRSAIDALLADRDLKVTSFSDWTTLDTVEIATGRARGKLREKFVSVEQMMNHLLRTNS